MGHTPHVLIDGPWDSDTIPLSDAQIHHLTHVIKARSGDAISYTDGKGRIGEGSLAGLAAVSRSKEKTVPKPAALDLAVAPPAAKTRARFLVEKMTELGVSQLHWLKTIHGANRVPSAHRSREWARSALEQSRGAWMVEVGDGLVDWPDLVAPVFACDVGAGEAVGRPRTVAIGPEGGWAEGEIPHQVSRWGLSPNVLRVETAAIVAASLVLSVPPG